jgi:hypothetical protein
MHRTLNLLRRPLAAAMVIAALASPALSEDFTESHLTAARETIAAATPPSSSTRSFSVWPSRPRHCSSAPIRVLPRTSRRL